MRLLTLTLCWWSACCLATSWHHRGRGPAHSPHGRGGQQGRAWEPGGLRQLRRLQDHGVNLEHLSARVRSRSPANLHHPNHLAHLDVSAGDVSRLDASLCLIFYSGLEEEKAGGGEMEGLPRL